MKRVTKIFIKILILVAIFQCFIITNTSKAASIWDDTLSSGSNFLQSGKGNQSGSAADTEVMNIMNNVYSILFPLGVVITVIVGGVLGIKFMMASVEDKAKIKESLIPYIAGSIAIFGAFGIWKLVIEVFSALG